MAGLTQLARARPGTRLSAGDCHALALTQGLAHGTAHSLFFYFRFTLQRRPVASEQGMALRTPYFHSVCHAVQLVVLWECCDQQCLELQLQMERRSESYVVWSAGLSSRACTEVQMCNCPQATLFVMRWLACCSCEAWLDS